LFKEKYIEEKSSVYINTIAVQIHIAMLLLLPLLGLLATVHAAGVALHQTVASRVHRSLPLDIQHADYLPFFLAGTFLPDAFYSCSTWHNASEDAHWPPFLATAVEYYIELEQQGVDITDVAHVTDVGVELLQLKALIYGVFTHQVGDSSWHSLRLNQGLLQMLAATEFDGDVSQAHAYLDTAGDFIHLLKVADVEYYTTLWRLPKLEYIVEIFQRRGFNVRGPELVQCLNVGRSALLGELSVREPTGRVMAQQSPLLALLLESYFIGGIREVTNSVERCVANLNSWFDGEINSINNSSWDLCGSVVPPSSNNQQQQQQPLLSSFTKILSEQNKQATIISPYTALSQFGHSVATGDFLNNEPSIAVSSFEDEGSVYLFPLSEFTTIKSTDTRLSPAIRLSSSSSSSSSNPIEFPYTSNFGSSLHQIKLFDSTFLLVSEPGLSLLHVFFQSEKILTIYNFNSTASFGTGGHKQQFTTLSLLRKASEEFEFDDILVGSPLDDDYYNHSPQSGIVHLLSGLKIQNVILSGLKKVDIAELTMQNFTIPSSLTRKRGYEQFGTAISSDAKYIYISSRGLGVVFIYNRTSFKLHHILHQSSVYQISNLPHRLRLDQSSKDTRLFGEWIKTGTYHGVEYVLIGATAYGNGMPGGVFVYVLEEENVIFQSVITLRNIFSQYGLSQFGYDAIIDESRKNSEVLYISAPFYKDHGAVFKVKLSDVFHHQSTLSTHGRIVDIMHDQKIMEYHKEAAEEKIQYIYAEDVAIEGTGFQDGNDKGFTGLGQSLAYINGVLVVSEEFFGFDQFTNDDMSLTGRIGLYVI
jgi:glycosylphosphatidylinositol phospholipase D